MPPTDDTAPPMRTAWPDLLGDTSDQAGAALTAPAALPAPGTDEPPAAAAARAAAGSNALKPASGSLVRLADLIACGFGSGKSRWAPGTAGTLWAWAVFLLLDSTLLATAPAWAWGAVITATALIGIWASKVTALAQRLADPGSIVIDEIVAFWLVLWLITPASLPAQIAAFVLFRFFDAVKFGFVAWADRTFKGFGWRGAFGIVFDDLCAAFMTLLVLALWARVVALWTS